MPIYRRYKCAAAKPVTPRKPHYTKSQIILPYFSLNLLYNNNSNTFKQKSWLVMSSACKSFYDVYFSSAEVKECVELYLQTQYVLMARCWVKHRDNFTFTLY
jgi:hypothetical protein